MTEIRTISWLSKKTYPQKEEERKREGEIEDTATDFN
jgi:hypothetical protein